MIFTSSWLAFPVFYGCPFDPNNRFFLIEEKCDSFAVTFRVDEIFVFQVNSGKPVYNQRFQNAVKSGSKEGPKSAEYSASNIPSESNASVSVTRSECQIYRGKICCLLICLNRCVSKTSYVIFTTTPPPPKKKKRKI